MSFFDAYFSELRSLRRGGQREGQAAFNALSNIAPTLATKVATTEYDPFYRKDGDCDEFYEWLEREVAAYKSERAENTLKEKTKKAD